MDLRRQPSLLTKGALLRVWGMCWASCLLAISTASGQLYGPMPGGTYGAPVQNSLYTTAAPGTAFGPQAGPDAGYGFGPAAYDPAMELPNANGMQQPGELQRVNYSQALGDYGSMQVYGAPAGDAGIGANFQARPATWAHVRDLQLGVYTNEDQTVINGGSTFEFYVNDRWGLGGRVLIGGTSNDNYSDEYHFTGDLYAGTTRFGDQWIKGGVLYDVQDNFHKVGPQVGMLLFADRKHPISVDFAYGIGYGDPVIDRAASTITRVADDDTQLRAGTYITPNLQAGFSGNWLNWADGRFEDYNGYGAFVNLNLGTLNVNVDYTHGDGRSRGFVNVAYTFGGRRARSVDGSNNLISVEHPRDWITRPVMRDVALQTQTVRTFLPPPPPPTTPPGIPSTPGVVGNLTQVNFRFGLGTGGLDGVIDAGESFTVDAQLVNGSGTPSVGIVVGNVTTSSNLGVINPAGAGANAVPVGTLQPGQSNSVNLPSLGTVDVPGTAQPGDTFFVDFDVTADGQTRRFRVPVIVGTSSQAQPYSPATPL